MSRNQKLVITALALLTALLIGLSLAVFLTGRDGAGQTASGGKALVGGPFELVTHEGKTVTEKDFRGDYLLIYFGFTYCPDVCPTELQIMSTALEELGAEAEKVQPLLITIDPERDTPEALAQYVGHFHPRLIGLTGTPERIAAAARAYRVYYAKVEDESLSDYTMDHSSIIYFMGPDGDFLGHFGPGTAPEKMAERMKELME